MSIVGLIRNLFKSKPLNEDEDKELERWRRERDHEPVSPRPERERFDRVDPPGGGHRMA